jgi:hypothetical protein
MKNLSCDDENKKCICSDISVIENLQNALSHHSADVQLEASGIISNLAAHEGNRSVLAQSQCMSNLARLSQHECEPLKQAVAAAMQRISTDTWSAFG